VLERRQGLPTGNILGLITQTDLLAATARAQAGDKALAQAVA
jgi:CBS domain-containing membrane protein